MSTIKTPLDLNESHQAADSGVDVLEKLATYAAENTKVGYEQQKSWKPKDIEMSSQFARELSPELDKFRLTLFRNQINNGNHINLFGDKGADYVGDGKWKIKKQDDKNEKTIVGDRVLMFQHFFRFDSDSGDLEVSVTGNQKDWASTRADVGNDDVYQDLVDYLKNTSLPAAGLSTAKIFKISDSVAFAPSAEKNLHAQIAAATGSDVTLDFKNLLEAFPGVKEADAPLDDRFMALALLGYFRDFDGVVTVDFVAQTVTFHDGGRTAKTLAKEFLDQLFFRNYDPTHSGDINTDAYSGPLGVSLWLHLGKEKDVEKFSDNVIWDSASYYTLKNEVDSITTGGTGAFGGLHKTVDNKQVPLETGILSEEIEKLKAKGVKSESFVYYAFVVDQGTPKMWRITAPDPEQLDQRGQPKNIPVSDWEAVKNLNFALPHGMTLAESPEIQALIDQDNFDELPGQFIGFNSDRYLFETKMQDDRNILVLRVPVANSKAPTAAYPIAQSPENADAMLLSPEGDEKQAIHMTLDELLAINKEVKFIDPETGLVSIYSNPQTHPIKIFNPVTGKVEDACGYRWGFSQTEAVKIAVSLIKQLKASHYGESDIDADRIDVDLEDGIPEFNFGEGIDFDANSEPDEILEAAAEFFANSDFEYWYPGTDHLGPVNSVPDFDDPEAWSDPEGRSINVLLNDLPITRRRAAFLIVALLQYIEDSKNFGMTPSESREVMRAQQRGLGLENIIMGAAASAVIGTVQVGLGMVGQYWIMKRLQGGDSSKDDDEKVKQAMVNDPKWRPDFVTDLYDPAPDDPTQKPKGVQKFEATPEREKKIGAIMDSLSKGEPVLLLGESAQGKTALMIEVARRLSQATTEDAAKRLNVPKELMGKQVVQLDWDILEANTKYVGQYAEKIRLMKLYIEMHPDVIFFIDECHKGIGSGEGGEGKNKGLNDFYQKFKEMWGQKQFPSVLSTTIAELNEHFVQSGYDKSGAIRRRFKTITIDTYKPEDVKEMMRSLVFEHIQKNLLLDISPEDVDELVDTIYDSLSADQKNLLLDRTRKALDGLASYIIKNRIKNFDANATMGDYADVDPELWSQYVLGRSAAVAKLEDVNDRIADLHTSLRSAGWLAYVKKAPAKAWAWLRRKQAKLEKERAQCLKDVEDLENQLIAKGATPPGLAEHNRKQLDFLQGSISDLEEILNAPQEKTESGRARKQQQIEDLQRDTTEKLELAKAKLDQMTDIINSSALGDQDPEALRLWGEAQDLRAQARANADEAHNLERSVMSADEIKKRKKSLETFKKERAKVLKRLSAITGIGISDPNPKTPEGEARLKREMEALRSAVSNDFKGYTIKSSDIRRFIDSTPDLKASVTGAATAAEDEVLTKYNQEAQQKVEQVHAVIARDEFNKRVAGDPNSKLRYYQSLGFDVVNVVGEDQKTEVFVRYVDERGRTQSVPIGSYISQVLALKEGQERYGDHIERLSRVAQALGEDGGLQNLAEILGYTRPADASAASAPKPKTIHDLVKETYRKVGLIYSEQMVEDLNLIYRRDGQDAAEYESRMREFQGVLRDIKHFAEDETISPLERRNTIRQWLGEGMIASLRSKYPNDADFERAIGKSSLLRSYYAESTVRAAKNDPEKKLADEQLARDLTGVFTGFDPTQNLHETETAIRTLCTRSTGDLGTLLIVTNDVALGAAYAQYPALGFKNAKLFALRSMQSTVEILNDPELAGLTDEALIREQFVKKFKDLLVKNSSELFVNKMTGAAANQQVNRDFNAMAERLADSILHNGLYRLHRRR